MTKEEAFEKWRNEMGFGFHLDQWEMFEIGWNAREAESPSEAQSMLSKLDETRTERLKKGGWKKLSDF